MSKSSQTPINSGEWLTIRDFTMGNNGYTLPKYEAKFVDDVEMEYIENDIVLVKETDSFGGERMYHVPRSVLEAVSALLP